MAVKPTKHPSLIPAPPGFGRVLHFFLKTKQGRSTLWSLLFVLGFGVTIYFCWQQVSGEVLASSDYRVELDDVVLNAPPPWIHADLRKDVFRELSVEGPISIMDEDVLKRFQDAFSLQPWVEKVIRVSRSFPGKIHVELKYREPACIVAASGRWFPVDHKGYVLPGDDFSPSDLQELPRVVGIDSLPVISGGGYWNDKQVDAAAQIGAVLRPFWQELRLDKIEPVQLSYNATGKGTKDFKLVTKGNTIFIWGESRTSSESSSMTQAVLSNREKVAKLRHYFQQHGTLDVPGNRVRDLRGVSTRVAEIANP